MVGRDGWGKRGSGGREGRHLMGGRLVKFSESANVLKVRCFLVIVFLRGAVKYSL